LVQQVTAEMQELALTLYFDQNKVHQKMVSSIHCIYIDHHHSKLKKKKNIHHIVLEIIR
jgi:hypothetical protein